MGLFILIKSRGHLRRNRLSEKGTSKGKCVVRKFMDFSICKAEVCSLFMFVLLLKLFMGHFKNPQKSSHGSGIICVLITQLNLSSWLMGQALEPRASSSAGLQQPGSIPHGTKSKQTLYLFSELRLSR